MAKAGRTARRGLTVVLLILLGFLRLGGEARAQGGMVNLGFADCAPAGAATSAITNTCLSNSGALALMISFSPPMPIRALVAVQADVNIFTTSSTLSPWWHFESSGCRSGKIAASADFSGLSTCTPPWSGQVFAAMVYNPSDPELGGGAGQIRGAAGVIMGDSTSVSPSIEYYAFTLIIQRGGSSGPGSCGGCADRACFVVDNIKLSQPAWDLAEDVIITQGRQKAVTYNGGTGAINCPAAVQQKGSWGAIKAIYR
jgi:hypothetical protein